MKHARTLRQAFVITVSLSSAAIADPPRNPAGCAATAPVAGSPCTIPGTTCSYRACGDYWTQPFVCLATTHTWRADPEATCNPPPPPPSRNPPAVRTPPASTNRTSRERRRRTINLQRVGANPPPQPAPVVRPK